MPLDNDIHVFDLETQQWSVMEGSGDKPSPRVGVGMAAVDSIIYVFAGRDKDHKELNEFYAFDTTTCVWKLLSSGPEGPPHRSVPKP